MGAEEAGAGCDDRRRLGVRGAARHGAAEIIVGDDQAADVDPLDLLAAGAEDDPETAVETTRLEIDLRQLDDPVVIEVDHDFRRWLTAIGRFTYGTYQYQGDNRFDRTYSVAGDLIYKMNRTLWVKGTLRRDWLDSNIPGNSTASTVALVGVRVQN